MTGLGKRRGRSTPITEPAIIASGNALSQWGHFPFSVTKDKVSGITEKTVNVENRWFPCRVLEFVVVRLEVTVIGANTV